MRFLVAMLAVLAMTTVASADAQVWFKATAGTGTVVTDGVAGGSTTLQYGPGPGASTWGIEVWTAFDNELGGIVGFDVGLKVGARSGETATALTAFNQGWVQSRLYPGTPGPYFGEFFAHSAADTSGVGLVTTGIKVTSFTLTSTPSGRGDVIILAGVAGGGWGFVGYDEENMYPDVEYGDNDLVSGGFPDTWASNFAIKIIPEPGTLMLLGLGLVGLLRRR